MLKLIENSNLWHLFEDDPVRPHLTPHFRTSIGRDAFILFDNDEPAAIICCAYTNQVPIDENELDRFSQAACQDDQAGSIAVFYTVWSYKSGGGRDILFKAAEWVRENRRVKRIVTLSPLTEMAEKFHTRNGAKLIGKHLTCQNFEYPI